MKVATWNVNSIRSRLERLLPWLGKVHPDVLCLQELKATDDVFPYEPIREAGYHAAVHGQKTYNGVAILSTSEPEAVERGMGDDSDDAQARLISVEVEGVRIISAYVHERRLIVRAISGTLAEYQNSGTEAAFPPRERSNSGKYQRTRVAPRTRCPVKTPGRLFITF